uniref:Uncharacterized protein n=1 Tax=Nelumbo nucifera TaxID=4432 RepID=A0A822Y1D3_NELNU|nr:TPA_asm: hypothetical protein HUJ06_026563 [Nelumbo nucifera]
MFCNSKDESRLLPKRLRERNLALKCENSQSKGKIYYILCKQHMVFGANGYDSCPANLSTILCP